MKPARLPRLLAAPLLALIVVLLNLSFIFSPGEEQTQNVVPAARDQGISISPASGVSLNRLMAITGPGQAQAMALPSPTLLPTPTLPARRVAYPPAFKRFIDRVADGQTGVIKGLYIPRLTGLSVIQQPQGDWAFVAGDRGLVTEFQSAARNGVTGLLAHNYLSGGLFYKLEVGDELWIVYGNRDVKSYRIDGIYSYQKLTPSSPQSDLIELATNARVTTEAVFTRFYRGEHKVTLQTCLEGNGLSNWGLTFFVALPIYEPEN
jgi:hypothetical protein